MVTFKYSSVLLVQVFLLAFPYRAIAQIKSEPTETKRVVSEILSEMVLVEGGIFKMGCTSEQGDECSSDEFPAHEVEVRPFYILSTEFTQDWWITLMGDNPSSFCRGGKFPVEMVSHADVMHFIDLLNEASGLRFRLPAEAEWEFAARGGNKSCGYRFSGSNDPNEISWNSKNAFSKTRYAKTKAPNELGIYDMSGNVWEWVQEPYYLYRIVASQKNAYPNDFVVRGGSYAGSPSFCRTAIRYHYAGDFKSSYLGFRLVLDQGQMPSH
ncbi:MAG: SUMF1/EgtB/PvdO family nonheme iron enzyme [Bacteroidia bacterium]